MLALIGLGFALGLDNFRTSIVLGGLKPNFRTSVKTSLIFGAWDGVAPVVGLLIGSYFSTQIEEPAEIIGAAGLAAYGLWITIKALRSSEHADVDMKTARRWLPVPLSIDNVAAGAALGLAGYSPWLAPFLFAFTTFVMSVAGHQIGRTIANFIPRLRTDLLTGLVLLGMAGLWVAGFDIL
ncbi:manganese efflux pump [Pseudarthrobacter sp. J75]|uniref:manganese efflux pump MntP n=1 Tax=unclassified Pseudarthrobacter TaxID=2647000 RepID=UPI002E81C7A7|nr:MULTISPECIES: manganese efflux pump [unclassified Pseudarthrobacter]MEE2523815.1 manganese efflux pump [Pseudarthrobacter sp. J47]MEE2529981.1 manganese efflux pump [Pseudarthrobacter sp. J75]MEE2571047.1 manganese efflux pump [Pseudarthrobacter sp. J64]